MKHVVTSVASRVYLCTCDARFTNRQDADQHEKEAS